MRFPVLILAVSFLTIQSSVWSQHLPKAEGWRGVRPGMTVQEVMASMAGEVTSAKKVSFTDGSTRLQAELKKKLKIDGLDYKVTISFGAGEQLEYFLFFNNKAKKESFESVSGALASLLGDSMVPDSGSYEMGGEWRSGLWTLPWGRVRLYSSSQRLNALMTGRLISINVSYGSGP